MATPVVSPYVLMQQLDQARRRGAPTDPYGVNAAIGSIGSGFDAMNKSIIGANAAYENNIASNERVNQGLIPAQIANQVSTQQRQKYDTDQHLSMARAVEEGHAAAAAQGLRAGTPQYQLFMRDYLSSHAGYGAASGAVPGAEKAETRLQNEAFTKSMLQSAIMAEAKHTAALEYYKQKARPGMTPEESRALTREALQAAKLHLEESQITVDIKDGVPVALGPDGQAIPISPQLFAGAVRALGDKLPAEAITLFSDQYRKQLEQENKRALTQRKVDEPYKQPVQPKPVPPVKDLQLQHLEGLEKIYYGLKADADPAIKAELKKEIADIKKARAGGVTTVGGVHDPNARASKYAGGAAAPTTPQATTTTVAPDSLGITPAMDPGVVPGDEEDFGAFQEDVAPPPPDNNTSGVSRFFGF